MMGSNVSDSKLKPTAKKPATRKPAPHAPELSKDDVYLFGIGMWERSWEKMGAHPDTQNRTAFLRLGARRKECPCHWRI